MRIALLVALGLLLAPPGMAQEEAEPPSFNTLAAAEDMEIRGGMSKDAASSLTRTVVAATRHLATRDDLELAVAQANARSAEANAQLTRWLAIIVLSGAGATVAGIGFLNAYQLNPIREQMRDIQAQVRDISDTVHRLGNPPSNA